ncbi:ImmA/IrrE family metallo-endopeptidase [Subtercola frigoramans]|uniref:Zn-dependent peptidase ImmA (M78 family) n=1 Tax=Subtercola frigoramans TaxID=120298 RepID=A0ABS2L6H4_9MICO|nr:ImmA/IrrE family metallo-endopeptidase [Subtercola frigoramans]MBM7472506.1 Zn-dependent peptidase ImmA (M78 family) [Subtercola frigoramans]
MKRLRLLVPKQDHPLGWIASQRVAGNQAALLARLADRDNVDVVAYISSLRVIRIEFDEELPDSGMIFWDGKTDQWVIVIRSGESSARQRFSILHEFKHIVDRGSESRLYDPRYLQGHVQAEMAADHFAASAVMPAAKVRTAIKEGHQTLRSVAEYFDVSRDRTALRLSDLRLFTVISNVNPNPERRELK